MRLLRWAAFSAVLLAGAFVGWLALDKEPPMADPPPVQVSRAELREVAGTKIYFGHQSVGDNILAGVRDLYAGAGLPDPVVTEATGAGYVLEAHVGVNEDPQSKLRAFDQALRSGLGEQVEVAMLKFCYVDILPGTDVEALFADYRDTIAALERDFPGVRFIKTTVPVMTEQTTKQRIKAFIKRSNRYGADENVLRERYNALIRAEYDEGELLDIAALESTTPDGDRVTGTEDGSTYFALYPGYAADNGHLNATGAQIVADAWLRLVAAGR